MAKPCTMLVAIDTSVLIGVLDARDVWHAAALRLHDALLAARLPLVYFDCVLAEASSTLARRLREQRRAHELPGLLEQLRTEFPPERLTWLFPDVPRLYGQIIEQMRQSAGELNFHDGLIALACRERQIRLLASFDRDFDTLAWVTRVATPDEVTAALAALRPPAADAPESADPV
jgi:predicted nucleic acid-binding protein